jgi:hypothetical protein
VRKEGLDQFLKKSTSPGLEPATLLLAAYWLNHYATAVSTRRNGNTRCDITAMFNLLQRCYPFHTKAALKMDRGNRVLAFWHMHEYTVLFSGAIFVTFVLAVVTVGCLVIQNVRR